VVTTFEFRLHNLASMANLGLLFWAAEDAREPLRVARDLIAALPAAYGAQIVGMSAPPEQFVPAEHRGLPGFAVVIVNWESAEDHARTIAPLRWLKPLFELVTPIPYGALQQMLDSAAPWGIRAYGKSVYLDDLSDELIDLWVKHLPRKASPLSITPVFALGGAYAGVGDHETAFGGSRDTRWMFDITALAATAELLTADRAWAAEFWTALTPHSGAGTYVNFLAEQDQDRIRASYGSAKYEQLASIKAKWDPGNLFHRNANIRPASRQSHSQYR
jgi:hypothetical protein